MASPEDAFKFEYRDAPASDFPARAAYFHFLEHQRGVLAHAGAVARGARVQSLYRENIGNYFDAEKAKRRDRRRMLRRKKEAGIREYDITRDLHWAVKGNKRLEGSKSEPVLNSEYRDKMRGIQGGFKNRYYEKDC